MSFSKYGIDLIEKKNSIYKNTEAMNKGLADSGYEPGKNGIQSVEYENTDFLVNKSKNEQNHVYRDADGMIRAKIDGAYIDGVTYTKFSGLNREKSRCYPASQVGQFRDFIPYLYPEAKNRFSHAALAQLVERLIRNQQIVSSNLTGGSIKYKGLCRNFLHKPSSFALFQGSNRVAK